MLLNLSNEEAKDGIIGGIVNTHFLVFYDTSGIVLLTANPAVWLFAIDGFDRRITYYQASRCCMLEQQVVSTSFIPKTSGLPPAGYLRLPAFG